MRDMDEMPPDQRAVLSLVLTQQRSYGEVASMLGIPEQSVRERAHAALDALAAHAASAPASAHSSRNGSDRGEPQPNVATPPSSAGASTAASSIEPAAASGEAGSREAAWRSAASRESASRSAAGLSGYDAEPRTARMGAPRPSSRLGGAILLGAIAIAVAVAAIVLSGGKGSGAPKPGHTPPSASSSSSGAGRSGAGGVRLDSRFSLRPSGPSTKASGQGLVVSQGKARAFYVTAQGLPPTSGFFYAVWLYDSQSDSYPLGRANVGSKGSLEGGGPLIAPNLASFHKLVITRETSEHPTAPGPIVLSGPFALH